MILYHGSNAPVEYPEIKVMGYYKDSGYGFYCTAFRQQAERWALTKRGGHIVNEYEFVPTPNLRKLEFAEMSDAWLDFVADCRRGVEHEYDVVEGPMADDQVWDYVEDFVKGTISRQAFWELARFKHPTHQVVFCTNEALACLTYSKHYSL